MQSLRSRAIYRLLKLFGSPFDDQTPIEEQRDYLERQSRFSRMPSKVDIQQIKIDDMYAEWVRTSEVSNERALLYLHGGGYTMGSCNTHRALAARISSVSHSPVLLIAYRLAPENPFPAALKDAIRAYHYLLGQGIEARRIVVAGDSAGGSLAITLSISLRDEEEPLPVGLVCISPWVDLTLSGDSFRTCANVDPFLSRKTSKLHANWYIGHFDPKTPKVSPVFADLRELPPLLIQVGEYEILRSDSERLAETAKQAGVDVTLEVWEGMWHVWHLFAGYLPESQQAIKRIGSFINTKI